MTVGIEQDALLEPLRASPGTSGILLDFDGTLAPIVADPDRAAPLDGAGPVLRALARRYRRVAVISGRPVAFLERHVPRSVEMIGLYGLETLRRGRRRDASGAFAWRDVIADSATRAGARGPDGMRVESKGLSITLHYRGAPELAEAVEAYAHSEAARTGLRARPAKMSVELHPPIDRDKGTVVTELATGLRAVLYAGDDVGDLPAFDALDGDPADAAARVTVRVAVGTDEMPTELRDRAEVVVPGPSELLDLLRRLDG